MLVKPRVLTKCPQILLLWQINAALKHNLLKPFHKASQSSQLYCHVERFSRAATIENNARSSRRLYLLDSVQPMQSVFQSQGQGRGRKHLD